MRDYYAEEMGATAVATAPVKDFFAEEVGNTPMFKTEAEGRAAMQKAQEEQAKTDIAAKEAGNIPKQVVSQLLGGANRAINAATLNIPENLMNKAGFTGYAQNEDPFIKSAGEAVGFLAPGGAPMRVIKGAEVIANPLIRNVVQGASAMATQPPTADRGVEDYAAGIGIGAAGGVLGRGVEKVAEGAIQQSAKGVSGRIHDYLLKLPTGAFKFGKDPVKVAADEGIVAGNMAEYEQLAGQRLKERSAQLEAAVQNSNKTVNVREMVDTHLDSAASKLEGSLKDRTAKIEELNTVRANLEAQYGDLTKLRVQDAIRLKRQLADDFPFTQEGAGDITTKSVHKIYHDINKFVEDAHPEIAQLNERVSGLIDIKNAARNRSAVEMRNNPVGLVGRLAGVGAAGLGIGAGAPVEGVIAGLGIMGIEKAIQSPAVLTRLAKSLSALSGSDRMKIMEVFPELRTVIKVDARDVEIIQKPSVGKAPAVIPRRQKIESFPVTEPGQTALPGKEQVIPALGGTEVRLGLPNLPAEGVYKGVRSPAIRLGSESGEGVIPMGQKPLTIEQGASQTPVRPLVEEQGETIIPIKKTPTPILKKIEKELKKDAATSTPKNPTNSGTPIPKRAGGTRPDIGKSGEVQGEVGSAKGTGKTKIRSIKEVLKSKKGEISISGPAFDVNPAALSHGTTKEIADKILKGGYKIGVTSRSHVGGAAPNNYGSAINLTPMPELAEKYATGEAVKYQFETIINGAKAALKESGDYSSVDDIISDIPGFEQHLSRTKIDTMAGEMNLLDIFSEAPEDGAEMILKEAKKFVRKFESKSPGSVIETYVDKKTKFKYIPDKKSYEDISSAALKKFPKLTKGEAVKKFLIEQGYEGVISGVSKNISGNEYIVYNTERLFPKSSKEVRTKILSKRALKEK